MPWFEPRSKSSNRIDRYWIVAEVALERIILEVMAGFSGKVEVLHDLHGSPAEVAASLMHSIFLNKSHVIYPAEEQQVCSFDALNNGDTMR